MDFLIQHRVNKGGLVLELVPQQSLRARSLMEAKRSCANSMRRWPLAWLTLNVAVAQ